MTAIETVAEPLRVRDAKFPVYPRFDDVEHERTHRKQRLAAAFRVFGKSHALYGKAFSALGRLLDPITQDSCIFYGSHSLYDDFNGVVLDEEEGRNVARALGATNKAVILQNHGFLTVGATVDEAAFLFISAEHSAQAQLLAEAAGTPKLIRHEVAAPLGASREYGWYSFKPYWDVITAEQPDLFA